MYKFLFMMRVPAAILLIFLLNACSKSNGPSDSFCATGYIYWGGDYAVDGIGFYFADTREGNWRAKQLKADELSSEFKSLTDSVAVNICLKKTDERAPCFCVSPSYYYKVVSIQKR
jgi:hypothetical protein